MQQIQELCKEIEVLKKQMAVLYKQLRFPNKNCYTMTEVAEMVGCSVNTVRLHEKQGKIYARFPNAQKRYSVEDVDWYLRGRMPKKKK